MDVDYLRGALREDAQLVGTPEPDLYEQVRARRLKSDRRRLSFLAAGLAALLLGIGIPISLSALQRSAESDQVANPTGVEGHLGLPTRGSLGDDQAFIDQVLQLPWPTSSGIPSPQTLHVAFAGDLLDQRWALLVGTLEDGSVVGTWFFAWAGADAKSLRPGEPQQVVSPDQPLIAVRGGNTESPIVVVTAPGDVVEISRHTDVDIAGTISRTYEPLETVDGVAITSIDATADCSICGDSVKVSRNGQQLFRGAPVIQGGTYVTPDPDSIQLDDPRGMADLVPDTRWLAEGFGALAVPVGRPIKELSPVLLFAGPIPGTPGWETTGIVVAITLPSGATAVNASVYASRVNENGMVLSIDSRIYVMPGGLMELFGLALLVEAPNGPGSESKRSLLIVAPPQFTTARALAPGDVVVSPDIALSMGVAIVAYPEPTFLVQLEGPDGASSSALVGDGDVTTRYADYGPGYSD